MKTLALDIGGVCLTLDFPGCWRYFGLDPERPTPPAWKKLYTDYSIGAIGTWAFIDGIRRVTNGAFTVEQIKAGWNSMLGTEIPETTRFLEKLRNAGWRIVFFSDTQPLHIERLRDILSYSRTIPVGIYSCDAGAQKPEAGMYEAFEAAFGKPDLYLDDRQCNIDGGLARGWNAVQFIPGVCDRLLADGLL